MIVPGRSGVLAGSDAGSDRDLEAVDGSASTPETRYRTPPHNLGNRTLHGSPRQTSWRGGRGACDRHPPGRDITVSSRAGERASSYSYALAVPSGLTQIPDPVRVPAASSAPIPGGGKTCGGHSRATRGGGYERRAPLQGCLRRSSRHWDSSDVLIGGDFRAMSDSLDTIGRYLIELSRFDRGVLQVRAGHVWRSLRAEAMHASDLATTLGTQDCAEALTAIGRTH